MHKPASISTPLFLMARKWWRNSIYFIPTWHKRSWKDQIMNLFLILSQKIAYIKIALLTATIIVLNLKKSHEKQCIIYLQCIHTSHVITQLLEKWKYYLTLIVGYNMSLTIYIRNIKELFIQLVFSGQKW